MNSSKKPLQKSSIFSLNPYNATGLGDSIGTSQLEALLSKIKANFGRNCQDKPNFTARHCFDAAQKAMIGVRDDA